MDFEARFERTRLVVLILLVSLFNVCYVMLLFFTSSLGLNDRLEPSRLRLVRFAALSLYVFFSSASPVDFDSRVERSRLLDLFLCEFV